MNKVALEKILGDPKKTAKAAGLKYISDKTPGISRKKAGKGYAYYDENAQKITDKSIIKRCNSMVLPPAWKDVWICRLAEGHLQATGYDTLERKQYRYHESWNKIRNETKYYRMLKFGEMLPVIREKIEADLSRPKLCEEKVHALIISLMERTFIRIGSASYEKLYGSYGLSTMRDKHVKVNGSKLVFQFKGKKGIKHEIELKNKKLAQLVKKCRDIPGYDLFQYYDEEGNRQSIDSGSVNHYLQEITGCDFTAKDFRTWGGTLQALQAFREIGEHSSASEAKKNIVKAIDLVSEKLGNTRTICKKYYIHPTVISTYQSGCLKEYLDELDEIEDPAIQTGLTCEEKVLMKLVQTIPTEI